MTGADSCLPCRKHHHNWLFRQGHNCLSGNGNMQNLHSCCLCCSCSVNKLSETADSALLTGPSIHKALCLQVNLVFGVRKWPYCVYVYLYMYASLAMFDAAAALSLPTSLTGVRNQYREVVTGCHHVSP